MDVLGESAVTLRVFPGRGHTGIQSPQDTRAVMEFMAENLYLRNLELERRPDIVEVQPTGM